MLVFPTLVQQGRVPNVDFLHLYGPASLDALALWFRIFGDSLESERTFGLIQHLGIIFAIYTITRAYGYLVAVGAAIVATFLILTPIGLTALAWHGGVAFGLWSLVFAIRGRALGTPSSWWVAGGLAGLALGFRPDLVVALGVAFTWALWRRRPDRHVLRRRSGGRIAADVAPPRSGRAGRCDRRDADRSRCSAAPRARAAAPAQLGAGRRCAAGRRRKPPAVVAFSGDGGQPPAVHLVLGRDPDHDRRGGLGGSSPPRHRVGRRWRRRRTRDRRTVRAGHPPAGAAATRFDPPRLGRRRVVVARRRDRGPGPEAIPARLAGGRRRNRRCWAR